MPKPRKIPAHISYIKALPCLCCHSQPCDAHHVRAGAYQLGKRQCDSKTLPLCRRCHTNLHNINESQYWADWDIAPLEIAGWLYAVTGNEEQGRFIVMSSGPVVRVM